MKAIFKLFDQENKMRLNKEDLHKYFKSLHNKMGDQFIKAAEVSVECYDDILWEFEY